MVNVPLYFHLFFSLFSFQISQTTNIQPKYEYTQADPSRRES